MTTFRGERVYRTMLRCLPHAFRERCEEDLVQWAREHAERRSGLRLWLSLVFDWLLTLVREWGRELSGSVRRAGGLVVALRSWTRHPLLAAFAVVTLGLGVGLSTAAYEVVHSVLLAPMPYPESESIVRVGKVSEGRAGILSVSALDLEDLQEWNRSFTGLAASRPGSRVLGGDPDPILVRTAMVSASFFHVMGVGPVVGQAWSSDEDAEGGEAVAVLSHGLWMRRWGGNPSVVGSTIRLSDAPFTVVGVMPRDFHPPETLYQSGTDLWLPLAFVSSEARANRRDGFLQVVGRLAPDVSPETAGAELTELGRLISETHPDPGERSFGLAPLRSETIGDAGGRLLPVVLAAGFLLAIACLNLTHLMLVRGQERRGELSIRSALGASRRDIARQLLLENAALGLMASVLGAAIAWGGVTLVGRMAPAGVPRLGELGFDTAAFALSIAVSMVTALGVGLAPALILRRKGNPGQGARRVTASRAEGWVRDVFLTGEVALSIVLVVGAGLLANSLVRLHDVPLGFHPEQVEVVSVSLTNVDDEATRRQYDDILTRIAALPGAVSVGATVHLPLTGNGQMGRMASPDLSMSDEERADGGVPVNYQQITTGYLSTMGVEFLAGRPLDAADDENAPRVVVVNESLGRRIAPSGTAVGFRFSWSGDEGNPMAYEVVGVVNDLRQQSLDRAGEPELYFPFAQHPHARLEIVARSRAGSASLLPGMRDAVHAVRPDLPIRRSAQLNQLVDATLGDRRFFSWTLGGVAGLSLVLTLVGVYGTLSYTVSRRRRELGVRMALGASRKSVIRSVMIRGGIPLALGTAIGLGIAAGVSRLLEALLFEVEPTDPMTLAAAAALVAASGLGAIALPALRAASVEPSTSLRTD